MAVKSIRFQILVTSYMLRLVLFFFVFHDFIFLRFLVRLTMNPQFIMSDDLSPVFSPLFFRENMSMLMVTDLFPQNQQRSDIISVLLYHLGVWSKALLRKLRAKCFIFPFYTGGWIWCRGKSWGCCWPPGNRLQSPCVPDRPALAARRRTWPVLWPTEWLRYTANTLRHREALWETWGCHVSYGGLGDHLPDRR